MKERRKNSRRPIIESFSLFSVVPQWQDLKLVVKDLSESGLSFEVGHDEFEALGHGASEGQILKMKFYLNQTLSLPIQGKIVRIQTLKEGTTQMGVEFLTSDSQSLHAIQDFLKFLDRLIPLAQVS